MIGTAAIGIICKAPRVGRSKTRLIPKLGATLAAELSACFLRDAASAIQALPPAVCARGYAVYAPADAEAELRALMPANFGLICHAEGAFGEVLYSAARDLLTAGHDCALLINSDSPTLPPALLRQAIEALRVDGDRVVFGPAADGGYYLIGLKRAHRRLFEDIKWSTDEVLATSLRRAAEIDLPVVQLATWYDVDDAEGLRLLQTEINGGATGFANGGAASATRAFLAALDERAPSAGSGARAHD